MQSIQIMHIDLLGNIDLYLSLLYVILCTLHYTTAHPWVLWASQLMWNK